MPFTLRPCPRSPVSCPVTYQTGLFSETKGSKPMTIRVAFAIVCVFALAVGPPSTFGTEPPETSHLTFVTEYIGELAVIEHVHELAEKELEQGTPNQKLSNSVYASTRFQLELGANVSQLKGMRLNPPFEKLIPSIITFNENKMTLHQRIIDISSEFLAGPKPDMDYGKLVAEVSQIRARLDYIDRALFEATPLIFATLLDRKPDSKNHLSHLIITKAERAKLIHDLTSNFGSKLDQKEQNWTVSAASVLKAYFLKDYKCSDEPWE